MSPPWRAPRKRGRKTGSLLTLSMPWLVFQENGVGAFGEVQTRIPSYTRRAQLTEPRPAPPAKDSIRAKYSIFALAIIEFSKNLPGLGQFRSQILRKCNGL